MIYLLLVIGLVLIYLSLKPKKLSGKNNDFNKVLQNKIKESDDLEKIIEVLKDFSNRIDNIEDSLLLIEEKLNQNNVNDSNRVLNSPNLYNEELKEKQDNSEIETIETHSQENERAALNQTLFMLFDEGKTVDEISSITRIGKGEILLRLGLRKQK